jgi:hypothetical protein
MPTEDGPHLLPSAILHFFALRNVAGGVNEAIFGFCATKKKRWWRQRSPWKRSAPPPKSNAITSVDYSAHTLFTYVQWKSLIKTTKGPAFKCRAPVKKKSNSRKCAYKLRIGSLYLPMIVFDLYNIADDITPIRG